MPPFVQNCLVPFSTYSSPTRVALVFIDSASDPESGSVRPRPPITSLSGLVNSGSQRCFCASVPLDLIPAIARPIDWMQTAIPAQPHESSSLRISSVKKSRPWPPYSSGRKPAGLKPSLCAFLTTSYGNSSVSSKWEATGRISLTANSCASSWIAFCSSVREKSSGIELGQSFGQDDVAVLVDRANLQLAGPGLLGGERHDIAGLDHAGEAAREPAQAGRAAGRPAGDDGGDAHLEHPVGDHAGQADRLREPFVEVDRVHVARGTGIGGDLLRPELHLLLGHERITNSARDRQSGSPAAVLLSVSRVTNRSPRRLTSDVTWACEVTESPTAGWRVHSNSCSAWRSLPKSIAASSSPKS